MEGKLYLRKTPKIMARPFLKASVLLSLLLYNPPSQAEQIEVNCRTAKNLLFNSPGVTYLIDTTTKSVISRGLESGDARKENVIYFSPTTIILEKKFRFKHRNYITGAPMEYSSLHRSEINRVNLDYAWTYIYTDYIRPSESSSSTNRGKCTLLNYRGQF